MINVRNTHALTINTPRRHKPIDTHTHSIVQHPYQSPGAKNV